MPSTSNRCKFHDESASYFHNRIEKQSVPRWKCIHLLERIHITIAQRTKQLRIYQWANMLKQWPILETTTNFLIDSVEGKWDAHIWREFYVIWMHCHQFHHHHFSFFFFSDFFGSSECHSNTFFTPSKNKSKIKFSDVIRDLRDCYGKMLWLWFVFHWFSLAVPSELQIVHMRMVVKRRVSLAHAQMPHFARLPLFAFVCKTSQFNKADEWCCTWNVNMILCSSRRGSRSMPREHDRLTTERTFFATLMDELEHD